MGSPVFHLKKRMKLQPPRRPGKRLQEGQKHRSFNKEQRNGKSPGIIKTSDSQTDNPQSQGISRTSRLRLLPTGGSVSCRRKPRHVHRNKAPLSPLP